MTTPASSMHLWMLSIRMSWFHAFSPQSLTLMRLRWTSLAAIHPRRDFHPHDCARAGRTKKPRGNAAS
jgi:hypothetical protein